MTSSVIVFDLDDTLYEELSYVRGGFRAVAEFIAERTGRVAADECYDWLNEEMEANGRGQVFDAVLERVGARSRAMVGCCLQTYRTHKPELRLHEDAERALERYGHCPLYIVTDGNQRVQESKLRALGLYGEKGIKRCWISRRYGVHNEKPSPYCFLRISKLEKAEPERIVYIGDNPNKDFVGIKPLGFRTVRVLRGAFAAVRKSPEYEADVAISNLDELPAALSALNI